MHLLITVILTGSAAAQEGGQGPVGGALVGWGPVPVATDAQRTEGSHHLWSQLQTWVTLWDQDVDPQADPATYGDPEADPGFAIARARLGIDGFLPTGGAAGQLDYALSLGVAAPYDAISDTDVDVQLVDAFGRWALPSSVGLTSLSLGVQRVPFSREAMISSADLVFQERAVGTNWLLPGREVGAQASQSLSLSDDPEGNQLLLRFGAFNGNGALFGDVDPGLLAVARLELIVGDAYRTWSPELEPALGIGVAGLLDADAATNTRSLQADLLARYSVVTLLGEVVTSTITPNQTDVAAPDVLVGTDRLGWLGQLSVFVPTQGTSGLELAGRYATFDDAVALDNNGDVGILHAGATYRSLLDQVDLGLAFIHRIEADAAPNDTLRLTAQIRPDLDLGR